MHILELDSFKLSDAVKFHNRLNPKIWGRDEHLLPEVREKLTAIADNFREFLGVGDLDVRDITISGSNAAYNYTPYSDIDLHLVVEFPADNEIYQELFNAKKYQYNDEHTLSIGGVPVELYVQNAAESPVSQGEYSISREEWIQVPRRKRAKIDDTCVRAKVEDLDARIHSAIESGNAEAMGRLWDKIKAMRQSGLEQQGEFGCENIVFKVLRNKGCIKDLRAARTAAQDHKLSLAERKKRRSKFRWGYGGYFAPGFSFGGEGDAGDAGGDGGGGESMREGHQGQPYSSPDGVAASTEMFLNEDDTENMVQQFIQDTAERLGIERMPDIELHDDDAWSEQNHSFGMYQPEQHVLHVNLRNRHIMDILRTVAHELAHCRQHELEQLDHTSGNTGSPIENEAHAVAGIIMRDFADAHPELFDQEAIGESSGYIPTRAQANDPRFKMALTVDVQPGQTGREANKMRLATDAQGHPQVLRADGKVKLAESLAQEFELFEEQDLFEINMGSKNLRREAAKTGAIAGMEFEMIVPGIKSEDPEQEPDYESDQRCRSIDDAVQFFHDGDYNGRRDVERLRERMLDDYLEWRDEKLRNDWDNEGEDYIRDWIANNVDDSEWKDAVDDDTTEQDAFDEFAINVHADPSNDYYNQAYDEFMEEFAENYNESDWLDEEDLDLMSGVENAYEITWPYWTDMNSGEIDADEVANEFRQAVGREVRVNTRYHQSGDRPGPNNQFYVVEPDGSLEGDNPGDEGLEFVSPPMPIDELLKDLNAVKAWAGRMGVYTNSSTGLHINISVPDYSRDRLDFVKLALLLGDEYVLKQFGRSSNTYAKSALGKVRDRVRSNPEQAQQLLDKMKGQMGELASKAIHSGSTDKYTSINTKSGHIEFRSPGGDWLDDNFDKIENTLLRFTVAMSAALNPEAYKEEYQKKLYKLLTQDQKDSDTIRYFSDYVAGKIPQAALRSFVKQAQLERKLKRGEAGNQPMWWSVSNPPHSHASIEVVASSKEEAIAKALGQDGYPSWANTRQSVVAKPLRPYEEKPVQPAEQGGGIYKVYDTNGRLIAGDEYGSDRAALARAGVWAMRRGVDVVVHNAQGQEIGKVSSSGEITPTAQQPSQQNQGNWGIWITSSDRFVRMPGTGDPSIASLRRFPSQAAAMQFLERTRAENPNMRSDIEIREIPADYQMPGTTNTQTDVNPLRPTGPGPWELASRTNNQVYFNPTSTDRQTAETEARTWIQQTGLDPAEFAVRTRQTAGSTPRSSYELYRRADGRAVTAPAGNPIVFQATNPDDAANKIARYVADFNLPGDPDNYDVRAVLQPGQPDAASGGIIDVEPDIEVVYPGSTADLAQQRATPGTFSGAWKVLVNGEEVYRFSGVGNNQSDANRVAAQWLRNNGRGVSGEGFEVYPIMTESLAESASDYEIHDRPKLDRVLAKCCRMVVQGQQRDPERYGQVAACVIDPDNRMIYGINLPAKDGTRRHAERVAIDKYTKAHGDIPDGSIVVTTCSPCNSPMEERHGESCKDLLNSVGIHKVYAGYQDPTQHDDSDADFRVYVTENDQLWGKCQLFAQTFLGVEELAENFQEPVNEIEKIRQFKMTRSDIDTHDQGIKSAKKLPGGSGLLYNIKEKFGAEISIYDPQKQGKNPVGRQIGTLSLSPAYDFPIKSSLKVSMIAVDPQYQGQGIAKAMYGLVLAVMKRTLVAGHAQSPGGRRNWVSLAQIPGVSIKGYVGIDNRLLDSRIDTIMGKLGGEYIGSGMNNKKFFAFDVMPGTNELKPAVATSLNNIYSDNWNTGLYATWSGTVNEQDVAEGELDEDWKSALATGAMAGAMAMGAHAKVPEIVRQAVEPGDTVYSIARQNNVNPVEIFKLNKMDRNTKLEIGQRVLVPDYSKPATAKSTVNPLPTKVAQPTTSKVSPAQDSEVTLLSMNSDAEAALQTAAKAAGLRGVELAQFMAQTRHESWDFSKMKEVGSKQRFAKYEKPKLAKQLGNKVKGDGELFKGRGFIQLTGRDNYTRASKQIFGDDRLVKNPDLASRLDVGAQIALWFWKNQVRPNVKNFNNTTEVVKAINAGEPTHVVQQRHNKFKEYLAVL
jgi:predicted chitinase/pyrimidine deaminase RibD-like protein